ncbi:hypothetical protein [Streptomyces sp. NPDC000994]
MSETTQQPVSDGTVPAHWCSWHKATAHALPVRIIEEGSARGGTLYACRACRQKHGLFTLAQTAAHRALLDHLAGPDNKTPCEACDAYKPCETRRTLRVALRAAHEAAKL